MRSWIVLFSVYAVGAFLGYLIGRIHERKRQVMLKLTELEARYFTAAAGAPPLSPLALASLNCTRCGRACEPDRGGFLVCPVHGSPRSWGVQRA